jgi:hypothetical protein
VWDRVDRFFLTFKISFVPREENVMVDSLVVSASNFRVPLPPKLKYDVEVKYRPYIPDNVKHWKVFEDDLEIKNFMETVDDFSALHINQEPNSASSPHANEFLNKIDDHHTMQLLRNHIPKGLVPLERIFQNNYVVVKDGRLIDDADISECNIGMKKNPKFVKMSSSLSREKRVEYIEFL